MPSDRIAPEPVTSSRVALHVDGLASTADAGQSVAALLLAQGPYVMRISPNRRTPRSAFCMMGACQECAILIDGAIRQACQVEVREGMEIFRTGAGMGADAVKTGDRRTHDESDA